MIAILLLAGLSVSLVSRTMSKCCPPLQFQTYMDKMTSSGSRNEKKFSQMMFSYDAKSNRTAWHYLAHSERDEYNVIADFPAGKVYTWTRETCNVSKSGIFHPMCITAPLVQRTFMGVAPAIIQLDTYMITDYYYKAFYRVDPLKCTFVEFGVFSSVIPQPDGQSLWLFYNTTLGIKDASIFTPPKICFKNATRIDRKPCFLSKHAFNFLEGPNDCYR